MFFNFYTQINNNKNAILVEKLFLDALVYVKFFQNFFFENFRTYFKK